MILARDRIEQERVSGRIVIEPFCEEQYQPNGYDITLGPYYWLPRTPGKDRYYTDEYPDEGIYKPWSEKSQHDHWADTFESAFDRHNFDHVVIPAHTVILAHTNEVIGANWGFVPQMECRSGLARSAVTICACAGFGDDGYVGVWTMEIHNRTKRPIWLPVGARVGQISFTELAYTVEGRREAIQRGHGAYRDKNSYGLTMERWTPLDMLPRLPKDQDVIDGTARKRAEAFQEVYGKNRGGGYTG